MISEIVSSAYLADLSSVYSMVVQHYLGPAVIILCAAFAVMYLVKREIRPMLVMIAMAVLVAIVLYAAPSLFSQNSAIVRNGGEIAKQIN
ncbi:MAG: DUF1538 domain-containing protein [Bifidobacterium crudilactis]|jgi:cell division protein FtsW (lipid II flippase)